MKLSGPCSCGNDHAVELSLTDEDAGHLVELSASVDSGGNVAASAELVRALVDAGVMACPQNLPRGRTFGAGPTGTIYT